MKIRNLGTFGILVIFILSMSSTAQYNGAGHSLEIENLGIDIVTTEVVNGSYIQQIAVVADYYLYEYFEFNQSKLESAIQELFIVGQEMFSPSVLNIQLSNIVIIDNKTLSDDYLGEVRFRTNNTIIPGGYECEYRSSISYNETECVIDSFSHLSNFNTYRTTYDANLTNIDVVFEISGVNFAQSVLGLSAVSAVGTSSGVATSSYNEYLNITIATFMHELGHSFGAAHDGSSSGPVGPNDCDITGYLMAAVSSLITPILPFSSCSLTYFENVLDIPVFGDDTNDTILPELELQSIELNTSSDMVTIDFEVSDEFLFKYEIYANDALMSQNHFFNYELSTGVPVQYNETSIGGQFQESYFVDNLSTTNFTIVAKDLAGNTVAISFEIVVDDQIVTETSSDTATETTVSISENTVEITITEDSTLTITEGESTNAFTPLSILWIFGPFLLAYRRRLSRYL